VLAKLERVPQAEAAAKKAAELDPKLAGPHRVLASLYAAQGDNARAYAEMQKEREISPNDPGVLAAFAQLAELNGKTAEAIAANEAIVAAHPENAQAWLSLGDLYAKDGKPAQSEAALRKVTEIDPANAYQTFFNIGAVLTNKPDVSQVEMRKAVEAFRKSIELKPAYGPANKQLVYSLLNLGELDQARTAIEAYLKVDAKSPDAQELASLLSGLPKKK
jgi:tetratricopeptide (TPR) repeat protein